MIYLTIIILNYLLNIFIKNGSLLNNVINPIFWILFSGILAFVLPKKYINKKNDNRMIQTAVIAGLIYIIVYSLFGVIVTFGKNPYSITLKGLIVNFWVTGVVTIGKEYIRYKIIANTKKSKLKLILPLVTAIYSIIEIDTATIITSTGDISILFRQAVSNVLPITIKNILFTHMATKYSCKPAIIYQILINMFFWISPILPNSPWILIAILDTVIPFILYIIIKMKIDDKDIVLGRARKEKTDTKGTIVFAIVVVLIACFSTGLFPVEPKAIATGSMIPTIEVGEVAIIKKCTINDVEAGDVIEYQLENQFIIHRIIRKETEAGEMQLIMKGDNNESPDAKPVGKEQVVGKVIYHIKYIGLPAIWLSRLMSTQGEALVETGK